MKVFRNPRYILPLLFCFLFVLSSAFAAPAVNPGVTPNQIIELDGQAGHLLEADHRHAIPLSSTYIANSNTGVFHYADCRYVSRMSPNHKVYYDSREDAINDGYRPCKVCRP